MLLSPLPMSWAEHVRQMMVGVPAGLTYLDNGHYTISTKLAKEIGGGTLPDYGRERLVFWEGRHWWLARTIHQGKSLWSVRDSKGWMLRDDRAVLSSATLA